ncbi:MAG: hypothetical protein KAJ10_06820 [Thermodesulfovibrionia bacterium]|nr:hypothetical protein [Thermodesulfovibrionia bacterium]
MNIKCAIFKSIGRITEQVASADCWSNRCAFRSGVLRTPEYGAELSFPAAVLGFLIERG